MKRDPVPPNIFLERLFNPSVVWQGESGNTNPDPTTIPDSEHTNVIGGSATEITSSAHLIMAVIAPWTEPFLAYLNRRELPEDQNEAPCIVRHSKVYKVHEGDSTRKALPEYFKDVSPRKRGRSSWLKFMSVSVVTTPRLGPL